MVGRKETKQKLGYNVALRSQEMMGIGASYQNNSKEGIDYDNKSTQLRFSNLKNTLETGSQEFPGELRPLSKKEGRGIHIFYRITVHISYILISDIHIS